VSRRHRAPLAFDGVGVFAGTEMTNIPVDKPVELMQDIPELGLLRGEIGVVCSAWFQPTTAYEVEFQRKTPHGSIRVLLMLNQISA
jgi:hypothetical protein